jgi:hypothetical protein
MERNPVVDALLKDQDFLKALGSKLGQDLNKADTINQATGLVWYDLSPVVQFLYPFKELIPLISKLPRVPGDGGTAHHWKRVTSVNVNNISLGVSEGNRGARIAIQEQDQLSSYKTMGLEASTTFEARSGSKNLRPEALGTSSISTLRSVMIGEEQTLILGNASTPLATTPTPTGVAGGADGSWGGTVTVYYICVALSGFGFQTYTPWNNTTQTGGVLGQVSKVNADGSVDTYGGGSAQPSPEANTAAVTINQHLTVSVTPVNGAVAYAWYASTSTGTERLVGITQSNQIVLKGPPSATAQPITALQVGGSYQDNSTNALLPDGILSQIYGTVFGTGYSTSMYTNPNLPGVVNSGDTIALSGGGSIVYTAKSGNTGLTISGTNISEFDVVLQAAYDQYKIGFDRILMSSTDLANFMGTFFGSGSAAGFRILFDAEAETGRIVAGRRVTSYLNKFFGNTLDIEVHPYLPPGTVIFYTERMPYELSGVSNVLCARTRQDYYSVSWPLKTRRYEYGVYVDSVFECQFTPGFAVIRNLNPPSGTKSF